MNSAFRLYKLCFFGLAFCLIWGACKHQHPVTNSTYNEESGIMHDSDLEKRLPSDTRVKDPLNPYTTCQLIGKEFVNKAGKMGNFSEYYLRCSVDDYFIKLCESSIKVSDLEPYLNKGITVEMEVKEGLWDHCSNDPAYAQSRIGKYAVIHKIIR